MDGSCTGIGTAAATLILPVLIFGAPVGPAVQECASCHPAEARLHAGTRMAHAMVRATESEFAHNLPVQPLLESNDGFRFFYKLAGESLDVSAISGDRRAEGSIEWVLGAGAQGQTPLVNSATGVLESRVSYFPQLHQYGVTVGQPSGASPTGTAALGRRQSAHDLQTCLACHSTAITRELQPVVPGIQCQRCHSGADEHARGNGRPFNPGRLDARDQVKFCGNCHRSKPPVDDAQLENVRFQPLRLMKSRCFDSGKLACTTCHPAHQDARRNAPLYYNAKCHACHDATPAHVDARQTADCIGCHMPNVELHPALRFTDHYIRVVKVGDLPAAIFRQRGAGS